MNQKMHPNTSLIIIDTITRSIDMSSLKPEMWGRELIEDVLPTLAARSQSKNVTIIIISESRFRGEETTDAVLHDIIARWVTHDLVVTREYLEKRSVIQRYCEDDLIAYLMMDKQGCIMIEAVEEKTKCSENSSVYSST
jgi:hypothetical protein